MKKLMKVLVMPLVLILGFGQLKALAQHSDMSATETAAAASVVGIASSLDDFSTLTAAVNAAGLAETLAGEGPFTVFAPTNAAFAKLPEGTVESLVMPENKATLSSILTYHVVAGKFDAAAVVDAIRASGGSFTIPTVQGGTLTATLVDDKVVLTDAQGNAATVIQADVEASNGIIHVIDTVVLP